MTAPPSDHSKPSGTSGSDDAAFAGSSHARPYFVAPFEVGERLGSWLDRTGAIRWIDRHELLADDTGQTPPGAAEKSGDSDEGLPSHFLRRLGDHPIVAALRRRQPLPPKAYRLSSHARTGYCPLCFASDLQRRKIPYFRIAWTWAFSTHCARHETPLFQWPYSDGQGIVHYPDGWVWLYWFWLSGMADRPPLKRPAAYESQLALARRWRLLRHSESCEAWPWRRQLALEQALMALVLKRGTSSLLAAYDSAGPLISVINDLTKVLLSASGASSAPVPINLLSGGLGPPWMYREVAKPSLPGPQDRQLRLNDLDDPAVRRSVVAVVGSLLDGWRMDLQVLGADPKSIIPGWNALTIKLTQLERTDLHWLSSRSDHWPLLARRGLEEAMQ